MIAALLSRIPLPWLLACVFALFAGTFWAGHHMGSADVKSQWSDAVDKQTQADTQRALAQQKAAVQVTSDYAQKAVEIKEVTKTIIQKVPVYVTQKSNNACTINNGFVRMWNAANEGVQLSDTATGTDAEASAVKLSNVAVAHAQDAEQYQAVAQQLTSLQDWVKGVGNE